MAKDPAFQLTKARTNLVISNPFFGSLALRIKFKEDPSIETSIYDGSTYRYNPQWISELSQPEVQGALAHSVMHAGLLHHTRRNGRDQARWDTACDYSINPILRNSGFTLPSGKFSMDQYSGKTADQIYNLLPPSNGDQPSSDDPGGDGAVGDSPNSQDAGASESEQALEESEWKMALSQAAHIARQAGKLPGDIDRMLEMLMPPQIPWKHILRRFMTEKANDDFSWRRGNRRFLASDLYLPTRESEGSGEMVVVIDTSGSITQHELNVFGSEIKGIAEEVRPTKLHVVYCDSRINHTDEFTDPNDIEFNMHGGGGTDFRPPFEWVDQQNFVPKCLVYLTDGYGPFPEDQPFYPTLWCINNSKITPPFGEHLEIDTQ